MEQKDPLGKNIFSNLRWLGASKNVGMDTLNTGANQLADSVNSFNASWLSVG